MIARKRLSAGANLGLHPGRRANHSLQPTRGFAAFQLAALARERSGKPPSRPRPAACGSSATSSAHVSRHRPNEVGSSIMDTKHHTMDTSEYSEQGKFDFEVGLFMDYLFTIEDFLHEEIQKHLQVVEQEKAITPGTQAEPSAEAQGNLFRLEVIGEFTNLLRRSVFVSLYSFFESRLIHECRSRQNARVLLKLSDLAGQSPIHKARTFITKVLGVDFPSDSQEWKDVQSYRLLRNCIVHSQGRIDEMADARDQKALAAYIEQENSLSIRNGEVYIGQYFCEGAFKTIKLFLLGLFHVLRTQYDEKTSS